ncbi:MAG: hypothetical protein D6696_18125 [Acidobacteria bacterium]|nr:MAG: hypothetical protein D6696_18125 [Acidobacteriota bacterium]
MKAWIGRNWKESAVFPLLMLLATAYVYVNACAPAGQEAPSAAAAVSENLLVQPKVIPAVNNLLNTSLVIRMQKWVQESTGFSRLGENSTPGPVLTLRTYGSPKPNSRLGGGATCATPDDQLDWTIPGPTYNVSHGARMLIKLNNCLPPVNVTDPGCSPTPPYNGDVPPNCFHGDDITNFHFHGFRVSPNPPQDWIYLKLRPQGSVPYNDPHNFTRIGSYQFDVDPLQDVQPVGTHWYHPHKHGSTALQVLNGMAGTFIVHGYFDQYLQRQMPGLQDKVLVVQQIREKLNAFVANGGGGQFYVNAQNNPIIKMNSGQIQRWRFIGATMQGSAHSEIKWNVTRKPEGPDMRQIAQDGVPFNTKNYQEERLNLARAVPALKKALFNRLPELKEDADALALAPEERPQRFLLGPGNRLDFLVQAPVVQRPTSFTLLAQRVTNLAPGEGSLAPINVSQSQPLLTLLVDPTLQPMRFPDQLPPQPWYLRDIENPIGPKDVFFSMDKGPGANPKPPNLMIDNHLYDPDRIDHNVTLGINETWVLKNNTSIAHPFHIHVNPFQVTNIDGVDLPQPWVWWDTIPIPILNTTTNTNGTVTIRQRFIEFTGEYVLHCHILGHEDRGMMQNVKCSAR